MYDNYNYPPGADGPDAPWNQSDPEPIDVDVTISQSLSKTVTLSVTDYIIEQWEDVERDEDGIHIIGGETIDFSESDFKSAYKEQEFTIPMLLEELFKLAQEKITTQKLSTMEYIYLERIKSACKGWTVDETEIIKD